MFSSRTLADRNNDPFPYYCLMHSGYGTESQCPGLWPSHNRHWAARPEYQHGTLPENPILTYSRGFIETDERELSEVLRSLLTWLENPDYSIIWVAPEASPANFPPLRVHAHRVLSLLAAVTR